MGRGRMTGCGVGVGVALLALTQAGALEGQEPGAPDAAPVRGAVEAARAAAVMTAALAVPAGATRAAVRARRAEVQALTAEVQEVTAGIQEVTAEVQARRQALSATTLRSAPAPWLHQDPADSLYRAARDRLNRGRYEEAAALFQQIREEHPRSGYVPDSYYLQALALQRAGGSSRLERALALLDEQERRHPDAGTIRDARSLEVRIRGSLARGGDAEAAAQIARQATAECDGEDHEMRSAALSALLQMDSERAVPILRDVLRSRGECSVELRRQAVFLVAQNMDDETVEVLLDLAHRDPDPDPEVRGAAVFWLSQVQTPEAVEALESILLTSADRELQERAIFAISQTPTERSARVLRAYVERPGAPAELREQAIFWLGQSGDRESRTYLRQIYASLDDAALKEKVIFGVAQNPSEADRNWLLERARDPSEPVELRKNALFWAGESGSVPVSDLRDLYRTMDDREMREQIIFVLAQSQRDAGAVDALIEIAESEQDVELRRNAIFWLGQSDDPRAAELLERLIRGGGS